MYLFNSAAFNGGDIIFQLIMFLILLGVPVVLFAFIMLTRNKKRLNKTQMDRIEEKLDRLLKEEKK